MNNVGQGVEYQAVTAPAKFPWLAVGAAVAAVVIIVLVVTLPIVLLSSSTSSSGSSSSSSSSSSSGPFDGVKQYFVIQVGSGLAITCNAQTTWGVDLEVVTIGNTNQAIIPTPAPSSSYTLVTLFKGQGDPQDTFIIENFQTNPAIVYLQTTVGEPGVYQDWTFVPVSGSSTIFQLINVGSGLALNAPQGQTSQLTTAASDPSSLFQQWEFITWE